MGNPSWAVPICVNRAKLAIKQNFFRFISIIVSG
jgi:hypothetical protein